MENGDMAFYVDGVQIKDIAFVGDMPGTATSPKGFLKVFVNIHNPTELLALKDYEVLPNLTEAKEIQVKRLAEMYREVHGSPEPWETVVNGNINLIINGAATCAPGHEIIEPFTIRRGRKKFDRVAYDYRHPVTYRLFTGIFNTTSEARRKRRTWEKGEENEK